MNRRELLRLASTAAALQATSRLAYSQTKLADSPFKLGVASGAPTPDGVVLWTKLVTPNDQPINVTWQIAHDERFERIALQGTSVALPALGHAVHAEVRGLQADRWYFYRFIVGSGLNSIASDVGRTRTAPAANSLANKLRFAFASCQNWDHGYYAAYRQMVADSPDLVVFLGDYMYEYASPKTPNPNFPRRSDLRYATTLADYRDRYALYKSDALLQAAHRTCPWIMTWDDHEVQNDYASDRGEQITTPAEFLSQRAAAYQAFYEHMPLPASALARGLAGLGQNDGANNESVRVQQRMSWGRLANFHLLDCRQYRDYQVCTRPNRGGSNMVKPSDCPELQDPNRSMLGRPQESWLAEGLALDAKQNMGSQTAPWSIVAQSTLLSHINQPKDPRVWTDGWAGYPFARQRLLDSLKAQPSLHPVVLSGDVHLNVVANVENLATEFCGTSITSNTNWRPEREPSFYADNPSVKYFNSEKHGYALAEVTPKLWTTTLMGVDDPKNEASATVPIAKFAVERGSKEPLKV